MSEITRQHWEEIYNTEDQCITPECLRAGWQTSSTLALTRLAMDLYHSGPVVLANEEDHESREEELAAYSVSAIFGRLGEWIPFGIQALTLK